MKKPPLLIFFVSASLGLFAQNNFAAANIPVSLLKNANVVVRRHDLKFEVLNQGDAIETEHKVMTILNERAEHETDQYFWYDPIVSITDIDGAVYDGSGQLIRTIKRKDVQDVKGAEYAVNDNRMKIIQFPRLPFPFTIEYTVVRKYHGLMIYPDFYPQESMSESVESASCEIVMPAGLEVRVLEMNLPTGAKTGPLRWDFHQITALSDEPFSPVEYVPLPRVLSAPTKFTMEGYEGDMSTWESYGKFIEKLNSDRRELPLATEQKLRTLTADCPDAACKVARVYEYLQQNTRYFFVGLGIGGWQPMPAKSVDEFKYSDCKGLSNYTVSMLRAVGVPAYYALIKAGKKERNGQYPDFPNPRFNHAFVCVPMVPDTLWLECTSQTESCGFLGDATDDRLALLITPEGGKMVHTPAYDEKNNSILRTTQLALAADGSAGLQSVDIYRGIAQSEVAGMVGMARAEQEKIWYENIGLSDFEITALDIHLQKGRLPEARCDLSLSVPKFASISGKRLFVPVVALAQKITVPPMELDRKYPIQASGRGITVEDNLTIALPAGYTLESGFESTAYSSPFGTYELSIKKTSEGQLHIFRKLVLNNSIQPNTQFESFLTFFKNIAKADKTKLVLTKAT
jgi:hypothetical protein